jgi:hypothetical protein
MLARFFSNCLCVFSIYVLLWGVSPIFADCDCMGGSHLVACSDYQDVEGACSAEVNKKKKCMSNDNACTCRTKTQSGVKSCICRKDGIWCACIFPY